MERLTQREMLELFDQQLKNAQKIQQKIIPKTNTFTSPYYSFYTYLKPFKRVGGDFYDFNIMDDDKISLIFADATGHGIDAAMLTGMVKLIYSYAMRDEEIKQSPGQLLKTLNNDIENLLDFSFFSCFSLLLDPKENKVMWNNAAHPSAYLISNEGYIKRLNPTLPLIGMHNLISLQNYTDSVDDFKPGDKIILFTDGIVEGKNSEGIPYEDKRIEDLIYKYRFSSIDVLCQVIINDFMEFVDEAQLSDDICLLGLQYDKE